MKIEIQKSEISPQGKCVVEFSSELGNASGSWQGTPPNLGETYHVEFSVGAPLTWGNDIQPSIESTNSLRKDGDEVLINALLEAFEEDGLAFLRIGGTVLMVDTLGNPPPIGTFVKAHIRELILSDTGI
jgi:hypothetical protein